MNADKMQKIKDVLKKVDQYKSDYILFLKTNTITDKWLMNDLKTEMYKKYKGDYIKNNSISHLYDKDFNALNQFKGETILKENEILTMWNVSNIKNQLQQLELKLNNTLATLGTIKNYQANTEENLLNTEIDLDKIIDANTIKPECPNLYNWFIKYYQPVILKVCNVSPVFLGGGEFGGARKAFLFNQLATINDEDTLITKFNNFCQIYGVGDIEKFKIK